MMKHRNTGLLGRTATAAVALLASVGLAAGCVSNPDERPAEEGLVKLRIATSLVDSIPYMTILQVAADKGWFAEAGIDVTIINASSGGDAVRLVTAGEADVTMGGPEAVYRAATSEGSGMTIMGAWFEHNVVAWISAKPDLELQGARFGITGAGSTGEFLLSAVNAARPELNITPVVVGGLGPNWAAAKADEIDAAYSAEPTVQTQIAEGGTVVLRPADIIGDLPMNLAAVRSAYAQANPDTVRAFWTVADRAFTYVREQTEAAVTDLNAIIEMDEAMLTASINQMLQADTAFIIATDCAGFANLANQWQITGFTTTPVDWSTVMDQQYLPEEDRCTDFGATG